MTVNRIYWGSDAPKNWKRAAPKMQSVPSVPVEFEGKAAGEAKQYNFVVSTSSVDRSSDTIDQSGWDLKAYRKNPVVLWAHDAGSWPVGKATRIAVENGRLTATVKFADTFEGRKAAALVDQGILKATSVGFRPTEYDFAKDRKGGLDFRKQELMEFSVVPVPANPDCLICLSAEEAKAERKAERLDTLAEIQARGRELAKAEKKEIAKASPILAQVRAERTERQRIAAMSPNELREHMDARAERKEERQRQLREMKAAR